MNSLPHGTKYQTKNLPTPSVLIWYFRLKNDTSNIGYTKFIDDSYMAICTLYEWFGTATVLQRFSHKIGNER